MPKPTISLPRHWSRSVQAALLHVISLAHYALVSTRSWAVIAVIERAIKTLKDECTRLLTVVPLLRRAFQREILWFQSWYNTHRPHTSLKGATPDEVYFGQRPANRRPRFEPRLGWPRASPCASPRTLVKGKPGVRLEMAVEFLGKRKHLPRVKLTRVAVPYPTLIAL